MVKCAVFNIKGKEADHIDLPEEIFGKEINSAVMHQAVVMYQASLRQGTLSTKGRAEISGGGKKPFKQKGTGRARAGSSRSPLWHGGGIIFGPKPRDFGYSVSRQIRRVALRESLNSKFQSKDLHCIDEIKQPLTKTKEFAQILKAFKLRGKILGVFDGCDESVERVSRNIPMLNIMRSQDVNAYDILRNRKLLLTKKALENLIDRIKK